METLMLYFVKANLLIVLFFLAYHFLLRKETFFRTNRWFLLGGLFTSLALPLITFKKVIWITPEPTSHDALTRYTTFANTYISNTTVEEPIDWMWLGWVSYGIIIVAFFVKILFDFLSLRRLLQQQSPIKTERFKLVDINRQIQPFSFFNYIVFNSSLYNEKELQIILLHEKTHSEQWHSLDVLVAQFFSFLFWINPIMWWYRKAMIQNLEYIADSCAISQLEDKKSYQHALLKVVSHQHCLGITNNFYQSLIKKRIVMLNTNQSQKKNSLKYAIMLPVLVVFFLSFQIETVAQVKGKSTKTIIERDDKIQLTFDANEDAKSLQSKSVAKVFKDKGVDVKISNVKTNKDKQITGLNITMKSNKGEVKKVKINQDEPINAVTLYANTLANGTIDFGVKQLSAKSVQGNGSSLVIKTPKVHIKSGKDLISLGDEEDLISINGNKILQYPQGKIFINGEEAYVGEDGSHMMYIDTDDFDWEYITKFSNQDLESLKNLNIDIQRITEDAYREVAKEIRKESPEIRKQIKEDMSKAREAIKAALSDYKSTRKSELEKMKDEIEATKAQIAEAKAEIAKAKAQFEAQKKGKNK